MRRPICLIGLAFVAALMAGTALLVRGAQTFESLEKEKVAAAGRVEWKEHRISGGKEVLVVSLEQVIVLKPDQTSSLKQIIADSDIIGPDHILADSKESKKEKEKLRREGTEQIKGILCYLEGVEEPSIGSYVMMEGEFRSFRHASNPGEFDAANYYEIMGKQGRLMGSVCLAESMEHNAFREGLYRLKEYLLLLVRAVYPQNEADIMGAMLLGEKGTLDPEIKSLYQQNGIIHILSISGLHLSVLGMGLYKALRKFRLPNVVNIIFSAGMMYCFGIMTGMGVSTVRALVMFCFHLGARLLGRTYDMLTAMTVAALSILVQQPLYLTHSGFLFSFGAICGIGLFLPAVEAHRLSGNRLVRALFMGIGISLSTLPVYLIFYYQFPPYSVLLNLLVIPCMSLLLPVGIVTMIAGALLLPLAKYLAWPGILLLRLYEKGCQVCLWLPGHQWITGCPAWWQTALFLVILTGLILFSGRIRSRQFWAGVLAAVLVLMVRLPQEFEITVLDVGQGDCIYLSDGQGGHYLIDGGSSDKKDVETYQILPFLKYRGVRYLDGVFVTHPDSDHISGIRGMLEAYEESGIGMGCLFLPDVDWQSRNEEYHRLELLAEEAGVPVRYIHAGQYMQCGKVMLTCIHPQEGFVSEDTNAFSTVLYLHVGAFSALLTGDLEGEGERMVIQSLREKGIGNITMLKAAHHGSGNSTSEEFVQIINPRVALISAGRDNSYGHPHEETLERLASCGCLVYQTPVSGAVTVRVKGDNVWISEYLGRP